MKKAPEDKFIATDDAPEVVPLRRKAVQSSKEAPSLLPLGYYDPMTKRWFRGFDVRKLDSDMLTNVDDQGNRFKSFAKIAVMGLEGIYDVETGEKPNWREKSSKLFYVDVFFIMCESIIKTKGTSLIATAYKCPQCGAFTKFENNPGEGFKAEEGFAVDVSSDEFTSLDMEDMRDLPLTLRHDLKEPYLEFEFAEGVALGDDVFTKYRFRIPEIGDYISKGGGNKNGKFVEKEVLTSCIIGLNDLPESEVAKMKSRHGTKLLKLSLDEFLQIPRTFNAIGYDFTKHRTKCGECQYEYTTPFDLTNFFGSLLSQQSS